MSRRAYLPIAVELPSRKGVIFEVLPAGTASISALSAHERPDPCGRRAREMSLHVISLGAGVQSSVMLLMAATGELEPLPAAAIFADTQWEPRRVYGHLAWLESEVVRLTDGKLPIYRVTAGDIRSGVLSAKRRFTPMPLFTASGGMGRRQCTPSATSAASSRRDVACR